MERPNALAFFCFAKLSRNILQNTTKIFAKIWWNFANAKICNRPPYSQTNSDVRVGNLWDGFDLTDLKCPKSIVLLQPYWRNCRTQPSCYREEDVVACQVFFIYVGSILPFFWVKLLTCRISSPDVPAAVRLPNSLSCRETSVLFRSSFASVEPNYKC